MTHFKLENRGNLDILFSAPANVMQKNPTNFISVIVELLVNPKKNRS